MSHPLVELARKQCYPKSQANESLITGKSDSDQGIFESHANDLVTSLDEYPHAFVLACLMDTGVNAEVAWTIPYRVYKTLCTFEIKSLYEIPAEEYVHMFSGERKWHRYPARSARFFYNGVHKIIDNDFMNGEASKIWSGRPSSRNAVLRFMDFNGSGFKVANMALNILYRHFGIEFADYSSIDIAPDVHTMRVFQRLGLTPFVANREIARIYTICRARELHPEFPGIVDSLCWQVGRDYCSPTQPKCDSCPLNGFCERRIDGEVDIWD
jgi:endonuclease III